MKLNTKWIENDRNYDCLEVGQSPRKTVDVPWCTSPGAKLVNWSTGRVLLHVVCDFSRGGRRTEYCFSVTIALGTFFAPSPLEITKLSFISLSTEARDLLGNRDTANGEVRRLESHSGPRRFPPPRLRLSLPFLHPGVKPRYIESCCWSTPLSRLILTF